MIPTTTTTMKTAALAFVVCAIGDKEVVIASRRVFVDFIRLIIPIPNTRRQSPTVCPAIRPTSAKLGAEPRMHAHLFRVTGYFSWLLQRLCLDFNV